jgi:hypothetical protein
MLERVLYERLFKSGFIKLLSILGGFLIAKGIVTEGDWTPAVSNFAEFATGLVILGISAVASWVKENRTVLFQRYLANQASNPMVVTPSMALTRAAADMKAPDVADPGPVEMTNSNSVRKLMAALLAFGLMAGCAGRAVDVSPDVAQRRISAEGLRAVSILQEARSFAKEAYAVKTLDQKQYETLLDVFETAGTQIGKLADVLIAYEVATTVAEQQTLATQAKAILTSLESVLPNISPGIGETAVKVNDLIKQLQAIRDLFRSPVPAPVA